MCTAVMLYAADGTAAAGRTMDFSHPLNSKIYSIRAGFSFENHGNNLKNTYMLKNVTNQPVSNLTVTRHNVTGIGQYAPSLILADGVNDAGLAVFALYFPGYAVYDSPDTVPYRNNTVQIRTDNESCDKNFEYNRVNVDSTDVTFFLLGMCADVGEAIDMLSRMSIIGSKDSVTGAVAPLHWMICDRAGRCAVAEKEKDGLHIYDNAVGVLSNSPGYMWHLTNLRNYINVTPTQEQQISWGNDVTLDAFGQAGGTIGLPGDFSPTGRFVRTAWLKNHAHRPDNSQDAVRLGFHILGNVTIPDGCVITARGTSDYTQYTVFYDLQTAQCYVKKYDALTLNIVANIK